MPLIGFTGLVAGSLYRCILPIQTFLIEGIETWKRRLFAILPWKIRIFASVSIDYMRPDTAKGHGDDRVRVVGTKGIVEVRDSKAYLLKENAGENIKLSLPEEQNIFKDFLKQVRNEGECLVSARDSFYVTEACIKARMSADENKIVYF